MSRNLGGRFCSFCGGAVVMVEPPRPVTSADVPSVYFSEYVGMIVAFAECPDCEGKYLAWVAGGDRMSSYWAPRRNEDGTPAIVDMCFRSTFNDEPGAADLPKYEIVTTRTRAPISPGNHWYESYGDKVEPPRQEPANLAAERDAFLRVVLATNEYLGVSPSNRSGSREEEELNAAFRVPEVNRVVFRKK